MALDCNIIIPDAVLENSEFSVVTKITALTETALGSESVYMRAKDTFKELLDGKALTEKEYASAASTFIGQLAATTTQTVINAAVEWAKSEKDMAYSLALAKAQVQIAYASVEKTKAEICMLDKEHDLKCAQITATIAGSIRDNGRVATYDPLNTCKPVTLIDEGTKFEQAQFIESQKYSNLADAYRKSGVVTIGTGADGVLKGITGDNIGYTDAQEEFARRQIKSFEDSKRNHAANAMSQMIGQMLSAEVAPLAADVDRWRASIDYLLLNTP